jgi:D-erythrose 4-phosphate dehydrogenase
MSYRIAINGYGRIGRCVLRALHESRAWPDLQIVAINDLTDTHSLVYLTRYDSTHGRFPGKVDGREGVLSIDGREVQVFSESDIGRLPWDALNVDLVMDCTGAFSDRATAALHLDSGARRVLISHPAQSDVDATVIYGVNHTSLTRGTPHHLQCVLHHQLRGACHSVPRCGVRHREWRHHDHSFRHERSAGHRCISPS